MSEQEIIEVWNKYYNKVFGYFYKRLNCREDVEDITSVVMTRVLDVYQEKGSSISNFDAYVWRVAHNQLVDFIRSKSRKAVVVPIGEDWDFVDKSLEDHRSSEYLDRIDELMECVKNNLKEHDKNIVVWSLRDEMTSYEIADQLSLTAVNVRKRLSRALSKLRDHCTDPWRGFFENGTAAHS